MELGTIDTATAGLNVACRLCMSNGNGGRMFDIFADVFPTTELITNTSHTFASVVRLLLNQEVAEGDRLPRRVCAACVEALQRHLTFRAGCDRTLEALRSLVSTAIPAVEQNLTQPVENERSNGQGNEKVNHMTAEESSKEEDGQDIHVKQEVSSDEESEQQSYMEDEDSSDEEYKHEIRVKQEGPNEHGKLKTPTKESKRLEELVLENPEWHKTFPDCLRGAIAKLRRQRKYFKNALDVQLAVNIGCVAQLEQHRRQAALENAHEAFTLQCVKWQKLQRNLQGRIAAVKSVWAEVKPWTSEAILTNPVKTEPTEVKPSTSEAILTNAVKTEPAEVKPWTSEALFKIAIKTEPTEFRPSSSGALYTNEPERVQTNKRKRLRMKKNYETKLKLQAQMASYAFLANAVQREMQLVPSLSAANKAKKAKRCYCYSN